MRSLRAQLIALLTALAVLLPSVMSDHSRFFCRMMNRVVATCCCDSGTSHSEGQTCQARATDCCERLTTVARTGATLKAAGADFFIPAASLAAVISASVHVASRTPPLVTRPQQARGPPGRGPPRFIVNCSLLT